MKKTIRISKDLLAELDKRKVGDNESYEDVIWDLVEDTLELNDETKKEIAQARADIKAGKFYTLEQIKKELRL